jgi:hypothetical protein
VTPPKSGKFKLLDAPTRCTDCDASMHWLDTLAVHPIADWNDETYCPHCGEEQ